MELLCQMTLQTGFSIIEGDGGYAANVVVDGQVTVKGNDFRYYLGLKSPKFECTYY